MEYKPASNTIKLNLSHRVLRREDFATGAENEDSLRTCLLFSPTSNPSSPELEQCRTPDLLHFFSHVPKQGRILSLMAFRCLAAKTSKKKKLSNLFKHFRGRTPPVGCSPKTSGSLRDRPSPPQPAGASGTGAGPRAGTARARRVPPKARQPDPSGTASLPRPLPRRQPRGIPRGHPPHGRRPGLRAAASTHGGSGEERRSPAVAIATQRPQTAPGAGGSGG